MIKNIPKTVAGKKIFLVQWQKATSHFRFSNTMSENCSHEAMLALHEL
jgi:hypothetical protein